MVDSQYIQEWPENKLTVAELRAVYDTLQTDGVVREIDAAAREIGERKIKAALLQAEGRAPYWVVKHKRHGYLSHRGASDEPSLAWSHDLKEAIRYTEYWAKFVLEAEKRLGMDMEPWSIEEVVPE